MILYNKFNGGIGMKEKLQNKIQSIYFSLLDIDVIKEYLERFKYSEIINEDIDEDTAEINISSDNELIKFLFIPVIDGVWMSIYRYHLDGTKYEQIDAINFSTTKDKRYNRVIKYSGHIEDDKYSYIMCSGYFYLDDKIVNSWKHSRVVQREELKLIQYSKDMNLTELICMTDMKSTNIVKKEEENPKALVLKLKTK